jgi:hypothetical protein
MKQKSLFGDPLKKMLKVAKSNSSPREPMVLQSILTRVFKLQLHRLSITLVTGLASGLEARCVTAPYESAIDKELLDNSPLPRLDHPANTQHLNSQHPFTSEQETNFL